MNSLETLSRAAWAAVVQDSDGGKIAVGKGLTADNAAIAVHAARTGDRLRSGDDVETLTAMGPVSGFWLVMIEMGNGVTAIAAFTDKSDADAHEERVRRDYFSDATPSHIDGKRVTEGGRA